MDTEIENKLAAARTRLILDKPFLGALVLRLPLVAADPGWCKSAATDAKKLYINQEYIHALDIQETQFVLAKHALHCALSHFARRQHRLEHLWEIACDYSVNPLLIQDGLKPPPGTLRDESFDGMTAEEIYPFLGDLDNEATESEKQEDDPQNDRTRDPRGDHGSQTSQADSLQDEPDSENKQPNELSEKQNTRESAQNAPDDQNEKDRELASRPAQLTPQEREQLSIQWQQRLAGAAQTAMQAGKLGGAMARMVEYMRQPQLPWRALLARYMSASARDDYSYSRPSSRRGDPAIFPSLRSAQINIAVGVDISGSVNKDEMNQFLSEVDVIKGNMRARITLLPCDQALSEGAPWIFEPWEDLRMPTQYTGGGGTSFLPVFEWVDAQDQHPDLLVYFTDAQGKFPEELPDYPVIWLVKGKQPVPWGQRVQLN